jgi:hypothetical protein
MRKITYIKSHPSGALSVEDWVTLERLLKFTTSELVKGGEDPITFIQFRYASNITEVTLEFTDSEAKDFQSTTDLQNKNS